jgi:A/G-specific adenine glycosylase
MQRFPSLEALASAAVQDVLAVWEGLGYYGRARNLHNAAQMVMQEYHGKLPDNVKSLCMLPGVGRYTAGAIASIAFGQDEPALDGNIRRVLARYFNVAIDARSASGEHTLWNLAAQNLPAGQAGRYNQAMMDLGASICTPKSPRCDDCPLAVNCQAKALGLQGQRPVLQPKPAVPHYIVTAAIIQKGQRVLITRRPNQGLLGGLWEFPGGKQQAGEELVACVQREIREELGIEIQVGRQHGKYRHAYTHFRVTLHAFYCKVITGKPRAIQVAEIAWAKPEELSHYPMGKIDRQISQSLVSSESL